MIGYERGWDEKDEMKERRVWNQSSHLAQSGPCAGEAQACRCNSGHLGIPAKLAAWRSPTEDVLESGVEVPRDV